MCVCLRSMQWWWFFWLYTEKKALRILCSHNIMDGSNSCELFTCGNYVMHTLGCWKFMRASKTRVHNIYLHFMCTKLPPIVLFLMFTISRIFLLFNITLQKFQILLCDTSKISSWSKFFRWKSLNFYLLPTIFKSLREYKSVFNINWELYKFLMMSH